MLKAVFVFLNDESGSTAVEYGLIATLIGAAIIGSLESLGVSVTSMWDGNNGKIVPALTGAD